MSILKEQHKTFKHLIISLLRILYINLFCNLQKYYANDLRNINF